MCKKIKQAGCNVLLVQKSILRDAVNELSLHFLSKLKILVLSNIERDDIDFIARVSLLSLFFSHLLDAPLPPHRPHRFLHARQTWPRRSR